jgi:hypothetical protein
MTAAAVARILLRSTKFTLSSSLLCQRRHVPAPNGDDLVALLRDSDPLAKDALQM